MPAVGHIGGFAGKLMGGLTWRLSGSLALRLSVGLTLSLTLRVCGSRSRAVPSVYESASAVWCVRNKAQGSVMWEQHSVPVASIGSQRK